MHLRVWCPGAPSVLSGPATEGGLVGFYSSFLSKETLSRQKCNISRAVCGATGRVNWVIAACVLAGPLPAAGVRKSRAHRGGWEFVFSPLPGSWEELWKCGSWVACPLSYKCEKY